MKLELEVNETQLLRIAQVLVENSPCGEYNTGLTPQETPVVGGQNTNQSQLNERERAATNEPELKDTNGVVWHPDFHASTQTTKVDGTWKARKGVDKTALNDYESQFVVVQTPQVTEQPLQPATTELPQTVGVQATFPQVVAKYTECLTNGKLVAAIWNGILAKHGLSIISEMAPRPDVCALVMQDLQAL